MTESVPTTAAEPGDTTTLLGRPADQYLDQASDELAEVKAEILRRLELAPGQRILDVGCGNGTDVLEIARRVGATGEVIGVDVSAEAINGAIRRIPDLDLPVSFQVAGANTLPFENDRFDACRSERMVQHLADPINAVAEMARVVRPGGRILVADPDHGMWAPDLSDRQATRTVLEWWFDNIRNPWIGRRLPAVLRGAGVRDVQVSLQPVVLRGLAAADRLTGLLDAIRLAGAAGVVTETAARALAQEAAESDAEGGFVMYGAIAVAEGRAAR